MSLAANVQVDIDGLVLLVAANSAPVLAAWALGARAARPIDGGRTWRDGERILGAHKTWRGVAAGGLAGAAVGLLTPLGAAGGLGFAALALAGDLASSFAKRRLRLEAGAQLPLLDQLPEALLPLIAFHQPLGLGPAAVAATAAAFLVLDLLATRAVAALRRG